MYSKLHVFCIFVRGVSDKTYLSDYTFLKEIIANTYHLSFAYCVQNIERSLNCSSDESLSHRSLIKVFVSKQSREQPRSVTVDCSEGVWI